MYDGRKGLERLNKTLDDSSSSNEERPTSKALFVGLLLFFLFEYGRPGSYIPLLGVAKLNTIIPVLVFLLTFFSSAGTGNMTVVGARNTRWLSFFLLLFIIQAFTADVTLYVYNVFKAIVGYLLVYFVIIKQVTSIGRIKAVFSALVFIHVALIILNPELVLEPEGRHYVAGVTFLGDGNDFAWSTCIVLPMALFLAQVSERKWEKFLFFGTFFLLVLAVVGTQSRGGSIALAALIIYLIFRGKRKTVGLLGLGMVITVVLLFAPEAYFDRMKTIKNYETEGSAQGRIMAWKSAVRMARDHPLIGVGAGHFPVKYGAEYRPPGVGRTELPWSNTHSIYFLALGEFGFTGMFILLGVIFTNLLRNERTIRDINKSTLSSAEANRKLIVTMQASLIGFAVGGVFLSGLYYPHLYVLAALSESVQLICAGQDARTTLQTYKNSTSDR